MKKCLALFALLALAATARADALAVWDSTDADTSGSYAATSTADGVTASPLAAGSGLTPYNSPKKAFVAYGYTATDYPKARDAADYWSVSLTADEDWRLSLSSLVYTFRHIAKGPTNWAWYYSTNGTTWTRTGDLVASPTNETDYIQRTVDLGAIGKLQNFSGTVQFRLVAWGATADNKNGTGCFGTKSSSDKVVLVFNGTAVSLAAPPTITFAGESTVGLSNTLSVAVSAAPEGSAVTSCTVSAGFPGTCSFANGTATIRPTGPGAVGNAYTLTAVATNKYGAATNTFGFAVTRYLPPGAVFIDFEDLPTTSSTYLSNAPVTVAGTQWVLHNAVTKMGTNDHCNGTHALRMNHGWKEGFLASASAVASNGLSTVSFAYATYGTYYTTGSTVSVEVSLDGAEWLAVGEVETGATHELATYQTPYIGISEPLFVRLRTIGQDSCNIDDILLAKYAADPDRTAFESYLLEHNVTPGDSLTAEGDDYDGDGATNAEEFAAGTDPYDKTSKP
ncbi:MAG: hypothetical protein IJS32_08595 [Kiritimatiellae bacterium]|nr:hypothetical protein [Kiritimatiellia bacterium]